MNAIELGDLINFAKKLAGKYGNASVQIHESGIICVKLPNGYIKGFTNETEFEQYVKACEDEWAHSR